jgi:tRNA 2-thiouridine synthesizing protein A
VNEIDARGLSCPMPVIKTKKAIEGMKSGSVVVIVDNATARDNVSRLAKSKGFNVALEKKGDDIYLTLSKDDK